MATKSTGPRAVLPTAEDLKQIGDLMEGYVVEIEQAGALARSSLSNVRKAEEALRAWETARPQIKDLLSS